MPSHPSDLRGHVNTVSGLSRGFMNSQVLFAANAAGIFAYLEDPCTAESIAGKAGWDERAGRILLDALVAMELLTKLDGRYMNNATASACLVPGKPGYQGNIIEHHRHIAERWARLPESLRSGEAVEAAQEQRSPGELRAFILGMSDIAKFSAHELADAVDLSERRHLLDLGGGPGTYSIVFLNTFPEMRATLFDRPEVVAIAREQVEETGLSDRFDYIEGDLLDEPFGQGYDLALLSNIIHSMSPEDNQALVRKCYDALEPGGILIIKDFLVDDDRSGPPFSLMFAVNMLVGTGVGDTYTFAEVAEWTKAAGFPDGAAIDLTPQSRLWLVTKQ